MNMHNIRKRYQVPAKRGMRVEYLASDGEIMRGVITSSINSRLRIRLDGNKKSYFFHQSFLGIGRTKNLRQV